MTVGDCEGKDVDTPSLGLTEIICGRVYVCVHDKRCVYYIDQAAESYNEIASFISFFQYKNLIKSL